jgi:hypothetical protein
MEVPLDWVTGGLTPRRDHRASKLPSAAPKRRDVEKPAYHRHVLQEMDLLIAVGEIRMPDQGGGDAPYRQHQSDRTGEQPEQ